MRPLLVSLVEAAVIAVALAHLVRVTLPDLGWSDPKIVFYRELPGTSPRPTDKHEESRR
jgi:hypothetical protein